MNKKIESLNKIMNGSSGVSIIICTYNGENVIADTLEYIFRQKVDDIVNWEIILVNNNSTDNTVRVAEKKMVQSFFEASYQIIEQPVPGKTNALKKGLSLAKYEFILICDDDNLLDENYVQTAYDIMLNNPQVGLLGGRGFPGTDGDLPNWFKKYENMYACGEQSKNERDITFEKKYVYGAGSVLRKSIFEKLNVDDYLKVFPGRKNGNLAGGEDNLIGYLTVILGYKIWYSNLLTFTHIIPKDRLKWNYVTNLKYTNGRTEIYLEPYTDFIKNNSQSEAWIKKLSTNIKHILSLIKNNGLDIIRKKEGNPKNLNFKYYLGKIKELLRLNFSYKKKYQRSIQYCKFVEKNSQALVDTGPKKG